MDPVEISKELAPYLASGWAGRKVVGPSLDDLGRRLALVTGTGIENIARVFINARQKLEARDREPNEISTRVLQKVIEVSAPQEDLLVTDYLGGVLASSAVSGLRDDRAVAWAALIDRLSSYTLRTHYVLYMSLRKEILDRQLSYQEADLPHVQIFIPMRDFATAVELDDEGAETIAEYVVSNLVQESLVLPTYGQSEGAPVQEYKNQRGIFMAASVLGIQLFMWGHGFGDLPLRAFVDPSLEIHPLAGVALPLNARLTKQPTDQSPSQD